VLIVLGVWLAGFLCFTPCAELLVFLMRPHISFTPAYLYMGPFSINIGMLVYLLTVARSLNVETIRKAEAFQEYTIVNGCSDSFTEIPAERV